MQKRFDKKSNMVNVANAARVSLATVSATIYRSAPLSAKLASCIYKNQRHRPQPQDRQDLDFDGRRPHQSTRRHGDPCHPGGGHQRDYSVLRCCSDEDPKKERTHLWLLAGRMVDGFIIATAGERV